MSTSPKAPKPVGAIVRAAAIEAVLIGIGMLLYFKFNSIWALLVPVMLGGVVFFFLVGQAGLFERRNDRS